MLPIRRLLDSELHKYEEHLLALDDTSRNLRFAGVIRDEGIVRFIQTMRENIHQHKLFVIEDADLNIIGVGHISLVGDQMELAFSVANEHRGKGYGTELMARCLEWCRNRGITKGYMVCLHHNQAVKKMAAKNGMKMHSEYGETTADIELPGPTAMTIMNEIYASNLAALDHYTKIANLVTYKLTFAA